MIRRVVLAVFGSVIAPLGTYLALVAVGIVPVWALVISAGVSVIGLGVGYWRTRTISTLGVLVLVRFVVSIAIASLTGDAQLVLAKDYVITVAFALVAALSLRWRYPLIARIRRDLAEDARSFNTLWDQNPVFRRLHLRLTGVWALALLAEAAVSVFIIYSLPLTTAVILTRLISPLVIAALVTITTLLTRRFTRELTSDVASNR